jgi:hypothetical protein
MGWLWGFLLWYTFDDALASAVANPGVGALPWWVVLLASVTLFAVTSHNIGERFAKIEKMLSDRKKD